MLKEKMPLSMKMSRFVALLGSALTLVQIILLVNEQEAICLNDGCAVVDSLTVVPPLFINIAGFVFFQVVFWGLWIAGSKSDRQRAVGIVLLAALAAEGVLVSFQHYIAQAFCSYCLIILALVILLNLFMGVRQIVAGAIVFVAVVASFASLQFGGYSGGVVQSIDQGTYATREGTEQSGTGRYLFFSSTCKYCEEVIESLREMNECTVRFNPIDKIDDFALESAEKHSSYQPDINKDILAAFGIEQIPVLLVTSTSGMEVIKGAEAIQERLREDCVPLVEENSTQTGMSGMSGMSSPDTFNFIPTDDACSIEVDCEEPPNTVE